MGLIVIASVPGEVNTPSLCSEMWKRAPSLKPAGGAFMHYVFVTNDYPPRTQGGIGSVTSDLANGLARAGDKVTVLDLYSTTQPPADRPPCGAVRLIHLRGVNWRFHRGAIYADRLKVLIALRRLHRLDPISAIETADFAGLLPWGGAGCAPVAVRLHGSNTFFANQLGRPVDKLEASMERRTIRRASRLFAVSEFVARDAREWLAADCPPITVRHNAVDTSLFRPRTDPPANGVLCSSLIRSAYGREYANCSSP